MTVLEEILSVLSQKNIDFEEFEKLFEKHHEDHILLHHKTLILLSLLKIIDRIDVLKENDGFFTHGNFLSLDNCFDVDNFFK